MERTSTEGFPPPPGIINSLKAGFDAIAAHIYAIILPILLNLFFWLGPRLRMDALFDSLKADMINFWKLIGFSSADIQAMLGEYDKIVPNFNFFWTLRTFPIGIFGLKSIPLSLAGLLAQRPEVASPLGFPVELQVTITDFFLWYFFLTVAGWVGGGIYFYLVAKASFTDVPDMEVSLFRVLMQTIFLSVAWNFLSVVIGVPARLILQLILQTTGLLGIIVMLLLSLVSMWVIVPVFFWPHGIFVRKQNFITSALSSLQIARFTLPTSSLFVLAVFLLSFGLGYLWSVPPQDSWMTLFGIFGHAFVTTGLLAASFIYYRDMNNWLQKVMDRVRASTPRPTM